MTDELKTCAAATEALVRERLRQRLPLPFPDDDAHGVFGPADPHARTFEQEWLRFRALVNARPAWPASDGLLAAQDALPQRISTIRGTVGSDAIAPSPADPRVGIWRDDALADGGDRLVLLELGVGWNTPVWIRYPFEQIARQTGATLIRINADPTTMRPSVPLPPQRYLPLRGDIATLLPALLG